MTTARRGAWFASPHVLVDTTTGRDRVGVDFGTAEDCVLVLSQDGVVEVIRPPAVLLQPGGLRCSPGTALADPESLRSPH